MAAAAAVVAAFVAGGTAAEATRAGYKAATRVERTLTVACSAHLGAQDQVTRAVLIVGGTRSQAERASDVDVQAATAAGLAGRQVAEGAAAGVASWPSLAPIVLPGSCSGHSPPAAAVLTANPFPTAAASTPPPAQPTSPKISPPPASTPTAVPPIPTATFLPLVPLAPASETSSSPAPTSFRPTATACGSVFHLPTPMTVLRDTFPAELAALESLLTTALLLESQVCCAHIPSTARRIVLGASSGPRPRPPHPSLPPRRCRVHSPRGRAGSTPLFSWTSRKGAPH